MSGHFARQCTNAWGANNADQHAEAGSSSGGLDLSAPPSSVPSAPQSVQTNDIEMGQNNDVSCDIGVGVSEPVEAGNCTQIDGVSSLNDQIDQNNDVSVVAAVEVSGPTEVLPQSSASAEGATDCDARIRDDPQVVSENEFGTGNSSNSGEVDAGDEDHSSPSLFSPVEGGSSGATNAQIGGDDLDHLCSQLVLSPSAASLLEGAFLPVDFMDTSVTAKRKRECDSHDDDFRKCAPAVKDSE